MNINKDYMRIARSTPYRPMLHRQNEAGFVVGLCMFTAGLILIAASILFWA